MYRERLISLFFVNAWIIAFGFMERSFPVGEIISSFFWVIPGTMLGVALSYGVVSVLVLIPGIYYSKLCQMLVPSIVQNSAVDMNAMNVMLIAGLILQICVSRYAILKRVNPKKNVINFRTILTSSVFVFGISNLVFPLFSTIIFLLISIGGDFNELKYLGQMWTGNCLYGLLFMPMTISVILKGRSMWKFRNGTLTLIQFIIISMALSVLRFSYINENKKIQALYEQNTEEFTLSLKHKLNEINLTLEALQSLFLSSDYVSRLEFKLFINNLRNRPPEIKSLAWVPRVPAVKIEEFVLKIRGEGYAGYTIKHVGESGEVLPVSRQKDCFPILYIEPFEKNKIAMGIDNSSEPRRFKTAQDAIKLNKLVVSEPLILAQNKAEGLRSLVFMMPVYENNAKIEFEKFQFENLSGLITGTVNVNDLIKGALSFLGGMSHLNFSISDNTDKEHPLPVIDMMDTCHKENTSLRTVKIDLKVFERFWQIQFFPCRLFFNQSKVGLLNSIAILTLIGLGLLTLILLMLSNQTEIISQTIDIRTKELKIKADELSAEISQRQNTEAALMVRTKEMEDQVFATLNLMEDAEQSRIQAENAEKVMFEALKKLELSNDQLKEFAHITSHDLKEPLRGISNYAQFLLRDNKDKLDEKSVSRLQTLEKLSKRMEDLIEALLNYSRENNAELNKTTISMQGLVEDLLDTMGMYLEESNVKVVIPSPLPDDFGDPVRITEIFRNLITNAVKYNDKPVKLIEIGVKKNEKKHSMENIYYVCDNGIGIQEKHLSTVFKMFKRLHGREKYGGGTGAGLSLVKKMLERHGGEIWLESTYGEGTTFYFTLNKESSNGP